jgi:major vault protein
MPPQSDMTNLVLPAGVYAFVMDSSKGTVSAVVGPHQKSLTASSEVPMRLDPATDRLVECDIRDSSKRFPTATQGQYIVLENPAPDNSHPNTGAISAAAQLNMGQRIVIPGPASFPLWPMQRATVLDGHKLRTDQYLVVEIYDEEQAKANKNKGFTRREQPMASMEDGTEPGEKKAEGTASNDEQKKEDPGLNYPTTPGHRFIVKGTEFSFYIPPTGYQVVPEKIGTDPVYVRTAVSLERLEYCTLLDEGGGRRIETGPKVVFPSPTETFITEKSGNVTTVKFKAIELDEIKGIYIKVTEDYEEDGKSYKRGDEIFITGREQRIYFPRPEHSIIRYGEKTLHFGIAIPNGEGRYVLDRMAGEVALVVGPRTFLPNPIKEVVVQRVLSQREVQLLFPDNSEVEVANDLLRRQQQRAGSNEPVPEAVNRGDEDMRRSAAQRPGAGTDSFDRGTAFSPPRTIVLGGKFDGAVKISVWPGFAVMLADGKGKRRVIAGPDTTLLEYDETPHRFALSSGTPKTDLKPIHGVYLQVAANTVSDKVQVETSDLCPVTLTLSYRVNFEGDNKEKWFAVSDYVALLTSTIRSMLRKVAKGYGIVEFQKKTADIIRDTILSKPPTEGGERPGRLFNENGMRVYDVDVLNFTVEDRQIEELLGREQFAVFTHEAQLAALQRKRQAALSQAAADQEAIETKKKTVELSHAADRANAEASATLQALQDKYQQERKAVEVKTAQAVALIENEIAAKRLELDKLKEAERLANLEKEVGIEVEAYVKRMGALGEKLAEALTHLGDTKLLEALSANLSVQSMLGGKSLVEVLQKALAGGKLGDTLGKLLGGARER